MPTSELSDALNPYYVQPRPQQPAPTTTRSGGVHAVQELLRFLASTREAQETERKRRIAWEQEQEAKYLVRQAEMERRMVEMEHEIAALKGYGSSTSPTLSTGSDSECETPPPVRRRNRHDTRCLTIQHAMRHHLLRVMVLETDKALPDSHAEGTALGPDEPVRFVWDKTPRQSVHNGRMKARVLEELRANRKAYRHVPDKDFGKKTLEAVFDQAYVTLRQKFKAQRDESAARAHRQREEVKAQRARRTSRRKVKLGNRAEARNKLGVFEHVTFDGALQLECMSSEESEVEADRTVFRIRGCAWRSVRLQRFFDALDEEDRAESGQRPRRGVGRKERFRGPAREGAVPPEGVSGWMVSKAWRRVHGVTVRDGAGDGLDVLGAESE